MGGGIDIGVYPALSAIGFRLLVKWRAEHRDNLIRCRLALHDLAGFGAVKIPARCRVCGGTAPQTKA